MQRVIVISHFYRAWQTSVYCPGPLAIDLTCIAISYSKTTSELDYATGSPPIMLTQQLIDQFSSRIQKVAKLGCEIAKQFALGTYFWCCVCVWQMLRFPISIFYWLNLTTVCFVILFLKDSRTYVRSSYAFLLVFNIQQLTMV